MKFTYSSDLQLPDVRTRIKNINKDGEETYITVYNIKGERRSQVINELSTFFSKDQDVTQEVFNLYYTSLILEFTDLILDTDDVVFMLNEGNLASQKLIQEFNDMIYEIQYQIACGNLAEVRNVGLTIMAKNSIDELEYIQNLGKPIKVKESKLRKQRGRRFIK